MTQAVCYLEIGSNTDRETNLAFARQRLCDEFAECSFSPVLCTQAVGMNHSCSFLNQTVRIVTDREPLEIKRVLKQIEAEAGRTPEEKLREIIRLDIDLLIYNGNVVKPQDLLRDFVRQGLEFFGAVM